LSVAAWDDAEDAYEVAVAGAFAALEFGGAFEEAELFEIDGGLRGNAVVFGVEADLVARQGAEDIDAAALLEDAGFLADDLECGTDAAAGQLVGQPQGRIVGGRFDVVFGVEPEQMVDGRRRGSQNGDGRKDQECKDPHVGLLYSGDKLVDDS